VACFRILRFGQRDAHRQKVVRLDTDIDSLQFKKTAHHQPCSYQEDNRQRELAGDQNARQMPRPELSASPPFLQRFDDIHPC